MTIQAVLHGCLLRVDMSSPAKHEMREIRTKFLHANTNARRRMPGMVI